MITRRFVATFHPAAEYDVTTRTTTLPIRPAVQAEKQLAFKTEGKVLTSPGWLLVYGKAAPDASADATAQLPPATAADGAPPVALPTHGILHAETTTPPPRYTEATLLSAMEGAGKLVDDEELADAMKERGLGTPATRAEIIEGLLHQSYLERTPDRGKRDLHPTTKAEALLEFLAAIQADTLTKPDMTGQWEYKLRQMEHHAYEREAFMSEIIQATRGIVQRTKDFSEDAQPARPTTITSPTDNQPLLETLRTYRSQDGRIMFYKTISGRKIEEDEIRHLLLHGEIGPLDGFLSPRTGRRYPAKLRLVEDEKQAGHKKVQLDYGNKTDLSMLAPFWTDPATGGELCEAPTNYILRQFENSPGDDATAYKELFKVGRLMCQKPITREHAIQLVTTGRTELIEGFISKKGRPFSAHLVRQGARISWEFPPRESKAGDGATGKRKTGRSRPVYDLSQAEDLGPSKQHANATLYRTPTHYIVAHTPANGATSTTQPLFLVQRTLCELELPAREIQSLLTNGKTRLLEGMVSKKGRAFNAYLVLSKDKSKAEFEFPET